MTRGIASIAFRILAVVFAMAWGGVAYADKRVALVIGNSHYRSIPQLRTPANDAADIAKALQNIGFDVTLKTDVAIGDLPNVLADFARKSQGADTTLFYYAGHGIQYQGKNYILPVDITVQDADDVEFKAISQDRVLDAMRRAGGGVKIEILDACRDNPLAEKTATRSLNGGGTSDTRGLARIDRTEGIVTVYSAEAGSTALDGTGRNSPFAKALLDNVQKPGVEIKTMFQRIARQVYDTTDRQQRPEIDNGLLDDYYLNPGEDDSGAWARIEDSQNPQDFANFVQKFPNSTHRRDAERFEALFQQILQNKALAEQAARDATAAKAAQEQATAAAAKAAQEQAARDAAAAAAKAAQEEAARQAATKAAQEQAAREAAVKAAQEQAAAAAAAKAAQEEASRQAATKAAQEQAAREAAAKAAQEQAAAAAAAKAAQEEASRQAATKAAQEQAAREAAVKAAQEQAAAAAAAKAAQEEASRQAAAKAAQEQAAREAAAKAAQEQTAAAAKAAQEQAAQEQAARDAAAKTAQLQAAAAAKAAQEQAARDAAVKAAQEQAARDAAAKAAQQQAAAAAKAAQEQAARDAAAKAAQEQAARDAAAKAAQEQATAAAKAAQEQQLAAAATPAPQTQTPSAANAAPQQVAMLVPSSTGQPASDTPQAQQSQPQQMASLEPGPADQLSLVCSKQADAFHAIDATAMDADKKLKALSSKIQCVSLRSDVDNAITAFGTRAKAVQSALKDMGCYAGAIDGAFNAATKKAISRYLSVRGTRAAEIRVTDDLVSELENEPVPACGQAKRPAPVAQEPTPKKKRVVDIPKREEAPASARPTRVRTVADRPTQRVEPPAPRAPRALPPAPPVVAKRSGGGGGGGMGFVGGVGF